MKTSHHRVFKDNNSIAWLSRVLKSYNGIEIQQWICSNDFDKIKLTFK